MIDLFEHNRKAYDLAVALMRETGKAAVIHPTGTGKSFIGFKLAEDNPDKVICWLSPSEYIFKTQIENLKATGADEPTNIKFFTYAKLMNMSYDELAELCPDFLVYDEFHRAGASMWQINAEKLIAMYPDAKILGLSATNIRYLDNQRDMADELFDGNVASKMSLGEAIARGILNKPKYVTTVYSYQAELDKLSLKISNSNAKSMTYAAERYLEKLRRTLEKADGLDKVFAKYITKPGKYIVFCSNYEHLTEMVKFFPKWFGGIDPEYRLYKAYSFDPETSNAFNNFKQDNSDKLKLLACIDMLNEGIHVEDISGVILFRPTESPIIFKQQIGRALASGKKGTPLILDVVDNISNLQNIGEVQKEMNDFITFVRGDSSLVVEDNFEVIDEIADIRSLFDSVEELLHMPFDVFYQAAKEYYEKNGNLDVPKSYLTEDLHLPLGKWIAQARSDFKRPEFQNDPVHIEQRQKLLAIGFDPRSDAERAWMKNYLRLKQIYEETGSSELAADYRDESGTLGKWCINQRAYAKRGIRITPEQIELLKQIDFRFDGIDSWEDNFGEFVAYVQEHGTTVVPRSFVTQSGLKLSLWLKNQKKAYSDGLLSYDRIQRLKDAGMLFEDLREVTWHKKYSYAVQYFEQNGHLRVPNPYVITVNQGTGETIDLGYWVYLQCKEKNRLSKDKIRLLNKIGMQWTTAIEQKWLKGFERLEAFVKEYGHANVGRKYRSEADGFYLGGWCLHQVSAYREGKLQKWQEEKLREVGFSLDKTKPNKTASKLREPKTNVSTHRHWVACYELISGYLAEHKGQPISKDAEVDGLKIHEWLIRQNRSAKNGKLDEMQLSFWRQLEYDSIVWEKSNQAWNNGHWNKLYEAAADFIRINGLNSEPDDTIVVDGTKLKSWIFREQGIVNVVFNTPRTAEQLEKLHLIGIVPQKRDYHEQHWLEQYKEAQTFIQEHGRKPKITENKSLFRWIARQVEKCDSGTMPVERADMLRKIGITIDKQQMSVM